MPIVYLRLSLYARSVLINGCGCNDDFRIPKRWSMKWNIGSKTWSVNNFDFYDLTAIIRKEWIVAFARRWTVAERDVAAPVETRSGVDEEVAAWMKVGMLSCGL